ncbi:MAG: MoaD/ThiS family protein [Acidobacteriota bacterium]
MNRSVTAERDKMPQVVFTSHLERYISCPPREVSGHTVQEVLASVFNEIPRLKSYILDEQGHLRPHMVIFVDGQLITDRTSLSDPVKETGEVYVMQALSGG